MTINGSVRAKVAFAVAASEASDYARDLVGNVATPREPGQLIRQARLMRVADLTLLDRAVIVERCAGASWDDIAEALGLPVDETRRRHEAACDAWAASDALDAGEWRVGLEETAKDLDVWHARTGAPWDAQVRAPVTRLLP